MRSLVLLLSPSLSLCAKCTLKQTEASEFGAEGYYRAKKGAFCPKTPGSPKGVLGRRFKGNVWGKGYGMPDFLLIGW